MSTDHAIERGTNRSNEVRAEGGRGTNRDRGSGPDIMASASTALACCVRVIILHGWLLVMPKVLVLWSGRDSLCTFHMPCYIATHYADIEFCI